MSVGWFFKVNRMQAGLRQDDIAAAARARGLPWTTCTVGAIETNHRDVSLEEFIALRGKPITQSEVAQFFDHALKLSRGEVLNNNIAQGLSAEVKVARSFGVEPGVVVNAANKLWGRGLSEERDRVVRDRVTPAMSPRTLQALRGHVTRGLMTQLAEALR